MHRGVCLFLSISAVWQRTVLWHCQDAAVAFVADDGFKNENRWPLLLLASPAQPVCKSIKIHCKKFHKKTGYVKLPWNVQPLGKVRSTKQVKSFSRQLNYTKCHRCGKQPYEAAGNEQFLFGCPN